MLDKFADDLEAVIKTTQPIPMISRYGEGTVNLIADLCEKVSSVMNHGKHNRNARRMQGTMAAMFWAGHEYHRLFGDAPRVETREK